MSTAGSFYYLRPGTFDVLGYSYGKLEGVASRRGKVKINLVLSGRWANEKTQVSEVTLADITEREVSEAEALQGPGTFVGSAICTTRVPLGGVRVWAYGLVTGYEWSTHRQEGTVDVNFGDSTETVPYQADNLQDVSVEIYALRPCAACGTSAVMPRERKQIHEKVYKKFNGADQIAVRNVDELVVDARVKPVNEAAILPIFDITNSKLCHVSVKHILDHVFYKDGNRPPPAGLVLNDSIFTAVDSVTDVVNTPTQLELNESLNDGLSDSEDDEVQQVPNPITTRRNETTDEPPRKRRRTGDSPHAVEAEDRLHELRLRCQGDQALQAYIDQLISLRRVGAAAERSSLISLAPRPVSEDNSQFRPSGTQSRIHQTLVHGNFSYMTPQQFIEHVQIHWNRYGFFPHPAVLRGLFSWDFGTRGRSIMHFMRVTEREKRDSVRRYDMSSFSRKNSMPAPSSVSEFSMVVGAVEVLANVANQLYQPVVQDLFTHVLKFLVELRVREMPNTRRALTELVEWIDERVEIFQVHIADGAITLAAEIKTQFSTSHEAFLRVN
ncbi:Ubiquitin carboxyl-terminal hydrolase isozyme L5 [Phytophthora nicotianae]|uniref:Ubiquitin carboxyl-terminal hydrolase isozyme L5 n=1 Tax=Phytophthora nicotianae TaxID=4792 RepID=A0A0W8CNH9_PHYNI|nr:Ubiquitin carboxyl-terminal hydrolase isozyme L5 [Phytophthora nicotianae]